jgi:hypothetical protein
VVRENEAKSLSFIVIESFVETCDGLLQLKEVASNSRTSGRTVTAVIFIGFFLSNI